MSDFKCGFVVITGPTNSGKSTLLNAFMGEKLSIVSNKPQTTYHGIRGVQTTADYQMIFTDTPGIQNYPQVIPRLLNKVADSKAEGCDVGLWVFDASSPAALRNIENLRQKIEKGIPREKRICALNKVDVVKKENLLPLIETIHKMELFGEIFPLSARKGSNVEQLKKVLISMMPVGPAMYPAEMVTDRSNSFRIAELVREKIYTLTHEEVPYTVYIDVEENAPAAEESKVPHIHASICVDSDSRKGILIGKKGEKLKRIGILARQDIEKITGHKICLKLHVKVDPQWTSDSNKVQRYLELQ